MTLDPIFTPSDWYWQVGADTTQFWSSATAGYVPDDDAAYLAWLAIIPNQPTVIADEDNLWEVLRQVYPPGLPSDQPYNYVVQRDFQKRRNLLINPEFRVNQRQNFSTLSDGEEGPDRWAGAAPVGSTPPSYDAETGIVTTAGGLSEVRQEIERDFWSAGYPNETLTVSAEDLEYVSGDTDGLELTIGGVNIVLEPGPGVRASTFVVPDTATGDFLTFEFKSGGSYRYKNLALVQGSEPFDGQPRNLQEETALCQWYYVPPVVDVAPLQYFRPLPAGEAVSVAVTALAATIAAAADGRIEFQQFVPALDITVDQMGLEVSTLQAGGRFVLGIYNDNNGSPSTLQTQVVSELTADATGFKSAALSVDGIGGATSSFTMTKNTRYWFAVSSNNSQQYRAIAVGGLDAMGTAFGSATGHYIALRGSATYSSDLPAFAASASPALLSAVPTPFIKARVA